MSRIFTKVAKVNTNSGIPAEEAIAQQKKAGESERFAMHHEVLLALSGYPGNVFTVSRETGLFEVVPDLPFIHPSEISLLNRICRLGTFYLQLKSFISEQNAAAVTLTPQNPGGSSLYLKALASGVDTVLDSYRQTLVRVEQKCISEPQLPLSHLQHQLEDYQLLLPSLDACIKHIHRNKLCGCQILSHLHEQCSTGIPIIQRAYERVLATCHGVLYKQLSAWMLHGLLLDRQGEFFIEAAKETPAEGHRNQSESPEAKEGAVQPLEPKSTSLFRIEHSLVPSYIPLRIIEKILFVGEAVQIFQSQAQAQDKLSSAHMGVGTKLKSDQFRFGQMLAELQKQPVFSLREFEHAIDSIRDCVAEVHRHLWRLLVEESNLVAHLQTIKDFFLLGRGELFLSFVDLAHSFMKLPPTPTTQHDVNVAFQQAMLKVGMENEDLPRQFTLTVEQPRPRLDTRRPAGGGAVGGEGVGSATNAWSLLGLSHTVNWPLHILFTPAILEKYNSLFGFLLVLRRAQTALQQGWALLMQYRERAGQLRAVWQLRTHMGFLVDNLQYYVQVDVLETQFSQLLEKINSTHDFETIKHAHESFVTTLQSQLFLLLPAVSRCLHEILDLCNSFVSLLHRCDKLQLSVEEKAEVEQIAKDFKRQSSLFFKIVSSVKSHHSAPHLAQLLLRVDYNKYFSTQNPLVSLTMSLK